VVWYALAIGERAGGGVNSEPGRTYYFISGLPRSGSTLLAAILRQNPRFHAGMSSPVASLLEGVLNQVSAGTEMSVMVDEQQRAALLAGLFASYYGSRPEPVIFDTNRAWTAKLPILMRLFPNTRLICCVRDVAWIMDSLERQVRQNALENTRLFPTAAQRATVYTRVDSLAGATSLVGFAWHALREACWSENADRLVMIDYDLLVARPKEVLTLLYDFLGEKPFAHDFQAVEYDAPEFDAQLGVRGLHTVRPRVEPSRRQTILPPDLFERYAKLSFWKTITNSRAFRIVAQPAGGVDNNEAASRGTEADRTIMPTSADAITR
jgi:sulfotransferase